MTSSRDTSDAGAIDRFPLDRIAAQAAKVRSAVVGIVAVLAGAGLVTNELPTAVDVLLAAVITAAAAVGPVWTAFTVRNRGEKVVTPLVDPRDDDMIMLVRADGKPLRNGTGAAPIR